MDRYERITALHRLLKSARYPVTVATLQDKLGVPAPPSTATWPSCAMR